LLLFIPGPLVSLMLVEYTVFYCLNIQ